MKPASNLPPKEPHRAYAWLAAAPIVLIGLWLVLMSRGWLPNTGFARNRRALYPDMQHWTITVFGGMFLLAGVLLGIPPRFDRWRRLLGGMIGCAFLAALLGVLKDLLRR